MSTAINITVDDGGLPARNRQQVVANRQALVQKIATEKSAALGVDQRSQERIAQGRDPVTGAPLIPPTSTGTLGASGGTIPRLNQQPAANRQPSLLNEWLIDHRSILTNATTSLGFPIKQGVFKNGKLLLPYWVRSILTTPDSRSFPGVTIQDGPKGIYAYISGFPTSLTQSSGLALDLFQPEFISGPLNSVPNFINKRPKEPFSGFKLSHFIYIPNSLIVQVVINIIFYIPDLSNAGFSLQLLFTNGSLDFTSSTLSVTAAMQDEQVNYSSEFPEVGWHALLVELSKAGLLTISINNVRFYSNQFAQTLFLARYVTLVNSSSSGRSSEHAIGTLRLKFL